MRDSENSQNSGPPIWVVLLFCRNRNPREGFTSDRACAKRMDSPSKNPSLAAGTVMRRVTRMGGPFDLPHHSRGGHTMIRNTLRNIDREVAA